MKRKARNTDKIMQSVVDYSWKLYGMAMAEALLIIGLLNQVPPVARQHLFNSFGWDDQSTLPTCKSLLSSSKTLPTLCKSLQMNWRLLLPGIWHERIQRLDLQHCLLIWLIMMSYMWVPEFWVFCFLTHLILVLFLLQRSRWYFSVCWEVIPFFFLSKGRSWQDLCGMSCQ